jgi:hypothetical protein
VRALPVLVRRWLIDGRAGCACMPRLLRWRAAQHGSCGGHSSHYSRRSATATR